MGKLNSTQTNKRNTVSGLTYDGAVIGRCGNGVCGWGGKEKGLKKKGKKRGKVKQKRKY